VRRDTPAACAGIEPSAGELGRCEARGYEACTALQRGQFLPLRLITLRPLLRAARGEDGKNMRVADTGTVRGTRGPRRRLTESITLSPQKPEVGRPYYRASCRFDTLDLLVQEEGSNVTRRSENPPPYVASRVHSLALRATVVLRGLVQRQQRASM
jgi:hypothetical protein